MNPPDLSWTPQLTSGSMSLTGVLGTTAPAGQPSVLPSFVMMAVIFGIFYLLVFAPMRKKQRKHAEMIENISTGAKVITNGGLHGTIKRVGAETFMLRIAEKTDVEVSKNAIAALQNPTE